MFNYSRYNCKRNFAFHVYGCNDSGGCSSNDNCALPFERLEMWDRIDLKLTFACIRGFRGKEQEVQFAKTWIKMNQKLEDNMLYMVARVSTREGKRCKPMWVVPLMYLLICFKEAIGCVWGSCINIYTCWKA
jgi:hypothetical protein